MRYITVVGASEHNIVNVDLRLPHGAWIALTGPSGSGKSTLAMHIIARESNRRYLGSLSAHARQYLDKLGRAEVLSIRGLPPCVTIRAGGQRGGPRSTVGTRTGTLDLLKQWFARAGVGPEGVDLTRAHFGYRKPHCCPTCDGLGVVDVVDRDRLVRDPSKSLRQGALSPTLKSGYTVYSQVTVDVMDDICRAHGFDVDTPWCDLTSAQHDVVMFGSRAIKVPFGKHSLASRLRWSGITVRARSEGYYRGLIPVIEETLKRDRNANVLRYVRTEPCSDCGASRLGPVARSAHIEGVRLGLLLDTPVGQLDLDSWPKSPVFSALRPSLQQRLSALSDLGLEHLTLGRGVQTLSDGEVQRVRLAALVSAPLSGVLYVMDEPTLGLHSSEQQALARVLRGLVDRGNTLLAVEHDPDMVRHADVHVAMGPGAGPQGGQIVYLGSATDHPLPMVESVRVGPGRSTGCVVLTGATLHNLQSARLRVHLGAVNVLIGPSGAGKSSLLLQTLVPALRGGAQGLFSTLTGGDDLDVRWLDAKPLGRTPRSTPATYTGLFDRLRKRLAATELARSSGLAARHFSHNTKAGRCPHCEGLGVIKVGLHLLQDAQQICGVCDGGRYAAHVLDVRLHGYNVAQLLGLTVDEALTVFRDPALLTIVDALSRLGLGYVRLGQSCTTLSGGEAQRVRLASVLSGATTPSLIVLDEPERGLHPDDIDRLSLCFQGLVDAGHTVVCIAHSRRLMASADHLTELVHGRVVFSGSPQELLGAQTPSGRALRGLAVQRQIRPDRPEVIALRGVCTHNLQSVDVDIPLGELVVVAGVSGSGKTSLAFDTLAAEAWSRFAESLPGQVRRLIHSMEPARLSSASGLTPVVAIRQRQARPAARSTVATIAQISSWARLLWSRYGSVSGLTAAHFRTSSPLGACASCGGDRVTRRCDLAKLLTDPERTLWTGAMSGSVPGRYFTEPDGRYLAVLLAAAEALGLNVRSTWTQMSPAARELALRGAGARVFQATWVFRRGKRTGEHTLAEPWPGLLALVEAEAVKRSGGKRAKAYSEPLIDVPCADCEGTGMAAPARHSLIQGRSLPAWLALPSAQASRWLDGLADVPAVLLDAMRPTLRTMCDLRLGHLSLDRSVRTLSGGELQRLRLARQLHLGLSGVTYVLDEPTAGLHARDVGRLLDHLRSLRDEGNTIVGFDHRPAVLRAADHIIELGPGAGPSGGRVIAQGAPSVVLASDSPTARALRHPAPPSAGVAARLTIELSGANLHNLRHVDLRLPGAGFVVVSGASGSGKSTLVRGIIEASARAGRPVGCVAAVGLDGFEHIVSVDGPVWSSTDTVLTMAKLLPAFKRLFSAAAADVGLPVAALSHRSPSGRCAACKGAGHSRVHMDYVADVLVPCAECDGERYLPEILALKLGNLDLRGVLNSPISRLVDQVGSGRFADALKAFEELGLGHLTLARSASTLSGGERQRIALASTLVERKGRTLVVLDEPGRGLHELDIVRLVTVLRRLADRGDLVLAVAHRRSIVRSADFVVEMGPDGGPDGGVVMRAGTPTR